MVCVMMQFHSNNNSWNTPSAKLRRKTLSQGEKVKVEEKRQEAANLDRNLCIRHYI